MHEPTICTHRKAEGHNEPCCDNLDLKGAVPQLCAGITTWSPLKNANVGPGSKVAGSLIGGIPATQELLDFCGEHGIVSNVDVINMQNIHEVYERVLNSDAKYRFVIDMASLKAEA